MLQIENHCHKLDVENVIVFNEKFAIKSDEKSKITEQNVNECTLLSLAKRSAPDTSKTSTVASSPAIAA